MEYPSEKHLSVMKVLVNGNEDSSQVDLDQILERLDYKTTKQSFQFTLRTMSKHGWVEKTGMEIRRNRNRVLIGITQVGRDYYKSSMIAPSSVTDSFYENEDEIDLDI